MTTRCPESFVATLECELLNRHRRRRQSRAGRRPGGVPVAVDRHVGDLRGVQRSPEDM